MQNVSALRHLIQNGIGGHAEEIAQLIVAMSTGIKFHLAAEDAVLYPALHASDDPATVQMSRRYQGEMQGIAAAYTEFARKWRVGSHIADDPDGFKSEANAVFRALHERIQKENQEFVSGGRAVAEGGQLNPMVPAQFAANADPVHVNTGR